MPWKTMCPNLAGFGEEFYSSGSRAELLRISVCAGSALLSSGLRWSPDELVLLLFSCQVVSLCDLMGCSTPGFPVFHYLLEFAQTHVHWVSDAIQPSHPLLSSSPPALNLSQQLGLFQWVDVLHHVTRVLELQPQSFGGYRTVTFSGVKSADIFHFLCSVKRSKILLHVSHEGEPRPCPKAAQLFAGCSSLVFASPPFPD